MLRAASHQGLAPVGFPRVTGMWLTQQSQKGPGGVPVTLHVALSRGYWKRGFQGLGACSMSLLLLYAALVLWWIWFLMLNPPHPPKPAANLNRCEILACAYRTFRSAQTMSADDAVTFPKSVQSP